MGFLNSFLPSGGLLGMGGMGASNLPMSGLLSGIDQQQMQNYRMKNFLLGSGIGLLSQGPSNTPITFGSSLGKGLASGLTASQQAQSDYLQQAQMGIQMNHQKQQDILAQKQDERAGIAADQNAQLFKYNLADAQRQASNKDAFNTFVSGLSPQEQNLARIDPNAYATYYFSLQKQKQQSGMVGDMIKGMTNPNADSQSHPQSLDTQPQNTFGPRAIPQANAPQGGQQQGYSGPNTNWDSIGVPQSVVQAAMTAGMTNPAEGAKMIMDFKTHQADQANSNYYKSPEYLAKTEAAQNLAKVQTAAQAELPSAIITAKSSVAMIDRLLNGNKFSGATGVYSMLPDMALRATGGDLESRTMINQLKGQAFLNSYNTLKGAGAISDTEGAKAEQAFTRLNEAQNDQQFSSALKDMKSALQSGLDKLAAKGGITAPQIMPNGTPSNNANLADPLGIRK